MEEEKRPRRVALLKKLIIAFLILGILIPTVLCIVLFVKVSKLQQQIDSLLAQERTNQQVQETVEFTQEIPFAASADDVWNRQTGTVTAETGSSQTVSGDAQDVEWAQESGQQVQEDGRSEQFTDVYLTFDDGPSQNTEEILDILKQYDVKATFFVIGKPQEYYAPLYRRIVEEGHTLGMHSYSHRYQEIYASKDAFVQDLDCLQEFLYETTGVWSRFYRFPGGSSNEVSKVDMHELTDYLAEEDIYYLDWNVSCQDATGQKLRPQQIADNVADYVRQYRTAVVLLHDGADKTSTVEALPIMLEKLLKMEDVRILPVSDDMDFVQHLQVADKHTQNP